eukprot:TRINITY_DN746_c0_g1_i2.p1 TRINITY_DN746_c0_g1~~TRINITY_DN746_c0_g1_i2.p1  ORF type:complete len:385 (+),score=75.72 TRINITY_DN746_c0_g1_i2:83-1156(+)
MADPAAEGGEAEELRQVLRRTIEEVDEMCRSPLQPVLHVPSGLGGSVTFQGACAASSTPQLARSPQSAARSPSAQQRASPRSGGSRELLLVTADSSEADSSEAGQWRAACDSVIMQQLGYDLPTPEYLRMLQASYTEIQQKLDQVRNEQERTQEGHRAPAGELPSGTVHGRERPDPGEVEEDAPPTARSRSAVARDSATAPDGWWLRADGPGGRRSHSTAETEARARHGTPPAPGPLPPRPSGGHGTPPRTRPPPPGHHRTPMDAQLSRSPVPRKQQPAAAEGVSLSHSGSARGSGAMGGGGDLPAAEPGPQVTPQKPHQPVVGPSAGGDYASDSAAWLTNSLPGTPDRFSPGTAAK